MASRMIPGEWTPRRRPGPVLVDLASAAAQRVEVGPAKAPAESAALPEDQTKGPLEVWLFGSILMALTIAAMWGASLSR
jgi:hypothetical protein